MIDSLLDILFRSDTALQSFTESYGLGVYIILFLIIFFETGVVVTPFLPGDSLLFAAGTPASFGTLNFWIMVGLISCAAIIGDSVNYLIGRTIGKRFVFKPGAFILKEEYYNKTISFYEKHGGKTIFLARFIPIIRTFAPFVAGAARMNYQRFAYYNVVGGIIWTLAFVGAGYLFGTIPLVQENFSLVVLAIIFISLIPLFWAAVRRK